MNNFNFADKLALWQDLYTGKLAGYSAAATPPATPAGWAVYYSETNGGITETVYTYASDGVDTTVPPVGHD
jgi:hypothetical protein